MYNLCVCIVNTRKHWSYSYTHHMYRTICVSHVLCRANYVTMIIIILLLLLLRAGDVCIFWFLVQITTLVWLMCVLSAVDSEKRVFATCTPLARLYLLHPTLACAVAHPLSLSRGTLFRSFFFAFVLTIFFYIVGPENKLNQTPCSHDPKARSQLLKRSC